MEAAIHIIWWIGLLGALALTAVLLKQVSLLLRVLRQIHQLGVRTRDAAGGLAAHAEAVEALAEAADPAVQFATSAEKLRDACLTIHQSLKQNVERGV